MYPCAVASQRLIITELRSHPRSEVQMFSLKIFILSNKTQILVQRRDQPQDGVHLFGGVLEK